MHKNSVADGRDVRPTLHSHRTPTWSAVHERDRDLPALTSPQSAMGATTASAGAGAAEAVPRSATASARTMSLKLNMLAGVCVEGCGGSEARSLELEAWT